jgi:enamine deaminase RidA (YjgF/YER057c/UK114 family)
MIRLVVVLAMFALALTRPAGAEAPTAVTFTGNPASSISSGVAIPVNAAVFWISGTPPSAPFGDMKSQAQSALKNIGATLQTQGLTLRDLVYLRVYLVADRSTGKVDYKGWFDAYGEAFGTAANPTKTARSTVVVAGLVQPDWLIEIEAFAVYPAQARR